jgi:hypothetical protein
MFVLIEGIKQKFSALILVGAWLYVSHYDFLEMLSYFQKRKLDSLVQAMYASSRSRIGLRISEWRTARL